ncbi:MAG: hypothetical protein IID32_05095, partial [Planctomycetes bacterium]|nr:hypothetical protein [Planctomycetota bacterium]
MCLLPNEKEYNLFAFEDEQITINIYRNRDCEKIWPIGKNWYHNLMKQLLRGANHNNFRENKLSIVTFNYERSLDYYLYVALKNNFGEFPESDILELFKSIRIVHVYGSLSELDITSNTGIAYNVNPSEDFNFYRKAARKIQIIGEKNDFPYFKKAREIIAEAKYVYFFGFGFDDQNMRYLGVQDWPDGKIIGGTHKDIRANNFASKVDSYIKKFNSNELIYKSSDQRYNNYYKPHWHDGTIDDYLMNIGFNYQSLSS